MNYIEKNTFRSQREQPTIPSYTDDLSSDDGKTSKLAITGTPDYVLLTMKELDPDNFFLSSIRFSSDPKLIDNLNMIVASFKSDNGQITPDLKNKFPTTKPNPVKITDIHEDPEKKRYLDIEILDNGDAIVTMRDLKDTDNAASICFKSAENGGEYPIMNAVFRKIAEELSQKQENKRI